MSDKKNFIDKLKTFLVGNSTSLPTPTLREGDLRIIRNLDPTLKSILNTLNTHQSTLQNLQTQLSHQHLTSSSSTAYVTPENSQNNTDQDEIFQTQVALLEDLNQQIRKLAKTQYKANTLQESQLAQHAEAIGSLQKIIDRQEKQLNELATQHQQALETTRLDLLKDILPILDSLDAAFNTGRRQVLQLPITPQVRKPIIAWLDGVRLTRGRLLDLLTAHNIKPISTVGQPFNPHCHVAVSTDTTGRFPDGTIVSEELRGYTTPDKILRFAEVVVARSN